MQTRLLEDSKVETRWEMRATTSQSITRLCNSGKDKERKRRKQGKKAPSHPLKALEGAPLLRQGTFQLVFVKKPDCNGGGDVS